VGWGWGGRGGPRAAARERVAAALALVELTGMGRRMPSQLSGGQQQRVAIARALVNEPAVLLLDEPFAALDLRLRLQMQRALKDIQRAAGTTFLFVTHDQHEAMTLSDRIAVMDDGRLLQVGTPEEVYERPRTTFVARFIGDANLFETPVRGGVAELGGARLALEGDGVAFAVRPERVRIDPPPAESLLEGTVVDRTFLGATTRYALRTSDGHLLQAQVPSAGERAARAPGDQVRIGWPAEAALVFPE
jgi:ABC-type Fe3+/spermidine/putrescine transport system ATPase subunit